MLIFERERERLVTESDALRSVEVSWRAADWERSARVTIKHIYICADNKSALQIGTRVAVGRRTVHHVLPRRDKGGGGGDDECYDPFDASFVFLRVLHFGDDSQAAEKTPSLRAGYLDSICRMSVARRCFCLDLETRLHGR